MSAGPDRIIAGDDCVAEGAAWLAAREPRLAAALALTGPLPLRRRADGFAALLDAIVGQQVSTAAAAAICARLKAAGKPGKVILMAIARRLLTIANAVLRTGMPFDRTRAETA